MRKSSIFTVAAQSSIFIAVAFAIALVLAACPGTRQYTRTGSLRDTTHTVQERGNGALIVWVTHDDLGAYCFGISDEKPSRNALLNHDGEVIIDYTDITPLNSDGCANAESSQDGSGFHTYKVTGIHLVPMRGYQKTIFPSR